MAYSMIKMQIKTNWETYLKNHAEFLSSITSPENYKAYKEYATKLEAQKDSDSKEVAIGDTTHAVSNSHYDPNKGLVDNKGNVIVTKERFEKLLNIEGIAISY